MPTPKKIVIVIDSWAEGNGAIVATRRMVKELEERGYTFTIVTTNADQYEGDLYNVPGYYLPGVREAMESMGFLFGKAKKNVLKKAFKGADLVMTQFPTFLARKAVNVARQMNIPVMGACHLQPQNIISAAGKESPFMEEMLFKVFNFCLYNHVDVLHCPSEFAAKLLEDHGSGSHFRVISNGIPREYEPSGQKRPEWFGDKFVILNIGRHAMEKRQELLIDGVLHSRYKDRIQLILAGKGEDSEKLRKRGEELPVKPLIEYISNEDKLTYLSTADLYLHSSVVELESLSCLEAIGCGTPCLIGDSPNSAAPQFAPDERFIFQMDNAVELGKKIDYWFERREELAAERSRVLKMAERYRMKKCIDEMEILFDDLIAHNQESAEYVLSPGIAIGT